MRFYIAAEFERKEEVRQMYRELEKMGHQISADWTGHRSISPFNAHTNLAARYSEEDIAGVKDCDVFGILAGYGKMSSAELGAAVAFRTTTGRPEIYVIGGNDELMLYYHPFVSRVSRQEFMEIAGRQTNS